MPAERLLPSDDAQDLIDLTREICQKDLAPQVDDLERLGTFPEKIFRLLGQAGLLSLPYPEEVGGGAQPYEVYLQVVEEIASVWM
ncbi:MAG: acyl-CoA dehydrogenase family protein, partial [Lapillicoccus sp.]